MKKARSFRLSKNIVLDKNRMDELYSLILKHCNRLSIQATTIDNSSIDFDSYDELMEYSNFQGGRIKTLNICGYKSDGFSAIIAVTFSTEYPSLFTVEYNCNFTSEKDEVIFLHNIQLFLQKAAYSKIPVIVMNGLTILILVFSLLTVFRAMEPAVYTNTYIIASFSALGAIYYFIFPFYLWKKLFPPVSFAWGEAANYYNRIFKIRSNIFWGIIVALIISVIANIISSGLLNT